MSMKKLLCVDDEETIRMLFKRVFEKEGFNVLMADSANTAVGILEKDNVQIIFTDLNMPGTNGLELGRKIRADRPMALIYAMTGYSSLFQLADCREAGFDDYFIKPISLELLRRTVHDSFTKLERWKKGDADNAAA
ncbi:response regulator [Desulfobacterales bacterium HSG17]|nr:response regulator [Desulfobacterales bacterium HSG17]